jgi:hypothetical protein
MVVGDPDHAGSQTGEDRSVGASGRRLESSQALELGEELEQGADRCTCPEQVRRPPGDLRPGIDDIDDGIVLIAEGSLRLGRQSSDPGRASRSPKL